MERTRYAYMESQKPWWSDEVRANLILARRKAAREGLRVDGIDAQVTNALADKLGRYGPPTDRTIRGWVQTDGDLPERMLDLIDYEILPGLERYLDHPADGADGAGTAEMGWCGPAMTQPKQRSGPDWGALFLAGAGVYFGLKVLDGVTRPG